MIRTGSLSDRHLLALRIYERAHLTGSFVLRYGAPSSEYFDKYLFESDPQLLRGPPRRSCGTCSAGSTCGHGGTRSPVRV
jgi:hypothetical protein